MKNWVIRNKTVPLAILEAAKAPLDILKRMANDEPELIVERAKERLSEAEGR